MNLEYESGPITLQVEGAARGCKQSHGPGGGMGGPPHTVSALMIHVLLKSPETSVDNTTQTTQSKQYLFFFFFNLFYLFFF